MNLIQCDRSYAEPILTIFNDAILNSTALYEYKPRTRSTMDAWFDAKEKGHYPVIGAVTDAGELMGFATYGLFRPHPAYKYSVEHSVYVDRNFRRQGIGKRLLEEIVAAARGQSYHLLIGAIDAENEVSIRLHQRCGFELAGTIRQAGFKFGRWLDLVLYQLTLDTPAQPCGG